MIATALILDVMHRGRAVAVDVPAGTRPLVALARDTWPVGHRETEGTAWFAFVETEAQPDRSWMQDTALWKLYVHALLGGWEPPTRDIDIFAFGSTQRQATQLAHHVIKGKKRGTTGWVTALEREGQMIPKPGLISIVTDGFGIPLCVIETERVEHQRFGDATVEIAVAEDEGDNTFEDWRISHLKYFTDEGTRIGVPFDDDSMVFHEYFKLLRVLQR